MLSKEFLNERGRNGSSDDEPAAAPAQTPDWLKNAGKYISNKIGLKEPVALPDYTASNQQDAAAKSGYTGIDPVQRQRAGMAPATQQEINRYMKDNPAVVGGLTDRNGNPIASGGAQEVERAARAAAPRRGADFDADAEVGAVDPAVIGNRFKTPNELGFQPGGSTAPTPAAAPAPAAPTPAPAPSVQTSPIPSSTIQATPLPAQKSFTEPAAAPAAGAAPAPMKGGYGSGMNNPSVAPKTAAAAAPATDAAAQYAAADAGRQPVKDAGENDEIQQMKKNAGLPKTTKAINPETGEEYDKLATDAPKTTKAINPETGEEYDKLATDDGPEQLGSSPDELEQMQKNAGLATAQSANDGDAGDAQAAAPAVAAPAVAAAPAQSANDGDAGDDLAKIRANAGLAQSANDGDAGDAQAAAPAVAAAPAPVKAFVEPAAAAPAASAPVDADNRRPGTLDPAAAAKYQPAGTPAAKPAAKSNPAVLKQQQELIAKGAKIKADGVMGPATQAAIKQFAVAPAASRSAAPAAPSAGAGRGFVNPTASATTAAKPAVAPAKPAAKPAAPAKPAVKESQEINRMRFLAGLSKD